MTTPTSTKIIQGTTAISPQPITNAEKPPDPQVTSSLPEDADTAKGDTIIKKDVGGDLNIASSPLRIPVSRERDKALKTKFKKLMMMNVAQEKEQSQNDVGGDLNTASSPLRIPVSRERDKALKTKFKKLMMMNVAQEKEQSQNDVGGDLNTASSPLRIPVPRERDKALTTKFKKLMMMNVAQDKEQRRTSVLGEYPASEVFREYFQSEKEIRKLSIQKSRKSSDVSEPDATPAISLLGVEGSELFESQACQVDLSRESSEMLLPEVGYIRKARCNGNCWNHMKGILLAIFSAMQISFAAYLASYLYKERYYSIPILVVTRFFSIFTLSAILMPFYINANVDVISTLCPLSDRDRKCAMLRLFFRSFLGTISGIFQYTSYKYITTSDCSVIMYCNPVFVSFGARIFLNEHVSICQTITALLAIVGVVLIAKPPFLNVVGVDKFDDKQLIGLGYAISAMFTLTSAILLLRSLRDVHFSLLNGFFGMVGLFIGFVVAVAADEITRTEDITRLDLLILVTLGILSFGGIVSMTIALHHEQAGPVATARSTDIIFSFFWQMISGIYPDALSIGGAVLVLTCVFLTAFYKYVGGLNPAHALRKRLWFVLK